MAKLTELPCRREDGALYAVVESPRGSQIKLKYDPALDAMIWSRPLVLGLSYPFDWGFFPSTVAEDGDPVDVMVLSDVATFPGVVIPCRAIGVLEVTQRRSKKRGGGQGRERNDRVLAVPMKAPRFEGANQISQLPTRVRDEIEHFFTAAVQFEGKALETLRWGEAEMAEKIISDGERRHHG